jgi:ABC-type hemin transport system substrate-binding protein
MKPEEPMDRKATIDRMNRQLHKWDCEIARFEKRARKVTSDLQQRVEVLQQRKHSAQSHTEALVHSSEDAWKELKYGAEKAAKDVKKALRKAKSKFR